MFNSTSFSNWWYGSGETSNVNNNENKESLLTKDEDTITSHNRHTQQYTFNAFQYHYNKSLSSIDTSSNNKNNNEILHCAPMKLSFSKLPHIDTINKNSNTQTQTQTKINTNINSDLNSNSESDSESKESLENKENNERNSNNNRDEIDSKVVSRINCVSNSLIHRYLDSLDLKSAERNDLELLHKWIEKDKLSQKMADELCFGDMILSYFSSFSPTNPDMKGCWNRWITYRDQTALKDVNFNRIRDFLATGFYNVGYDQNGRAIWVVNSKYYDSNSAFGAEVCTKATILFLTSLLWDLRNNKFDFNVLRKGIILYVDLSHFGARMLVWSIIKACKSAVIAFPWQSIKIYCANPPTILYLAKQFAGQVLLPHAMEKIVMLGHPNEFFQKHDGLRDKCPIEIGGKWKIKCIDWMKERGYLEDITQQN